MRRLFGLAILAAIAPAAWAGDLDGRWDATVNIQGPTQFDPTLQNPIIESVTASHPSAILVAPDDVSASQEPIDQAMHAGIKVVLVDTTLNDPSGAVSQISSDNLAGGAAAFAAIKQLAPQGGQVLVVNTKPGISTTDQRTAGFAAAAWGWRVDPAQVTPVTDVGVGAVELLRSLSPRRVIVSSPVYPPFFDWAAEAGPPLADVPLRRDAGRWRLDLDRLTATLRAGDAYLLCNPHNPSGGCSA